VAKGVILEVVILVNPFIELGLVANPPIPRAEFEWGVSAILIIIILYICQHNNI
jgi:hypothetical protein